VKRHLPALVAVVALLVAAPGALAAGCPQTSVADLENEVMCLVCGVPLSLADAPQAERERALIGRLARRCESKRQIKRALVAEYGPRVLAVPVASGFRLAAYLVPALVACATGLGIVVVAARSRRRGGRPPRPEIAATGPPFDAVDAARLEAELDRYRGE
jgi:cytochrome c-type biogenesis protein CcmH